MRIGIIGSQGQLGWALSLLYADDELVRLDRPSFDVTNANYFEMIKDIGLDYLINTSAYNEVDAGEDDLEGAFLLNAIAPARLAEFCWRHDIRFVTFSTDYVFGDPPEGEKSLPWKETDLAFPLSVYGMSKYSGERMVMSRNPDAIVIRTCGLYGIFRSSSRRKNFVDLMLQLALDKKIIRVVSDQIVTPTSTRSLAEAVKNLLAGTPDGGLYHMSNTGECSWYEFAQSIFQITGVFPLESIPVTQAEYGAKARRPAYSVLSKEKVGTLGVSLPSWQDALAQYLVDARKN